MQPARARETDEPEGEPPVAELRANLQRAYPLGAPDRLPEELRAVLARLKDRGSR
jgi:hypothetical protein